MAESLKVGDVVKLKSGGAAMVIEKIGGTQALCIWQDAQKETRSHYYQLTSLVRSEDEPMSPSIGIYKGDK